MSEAAATRRDELKGLEAALRRLDEGQADLETARALAADGDWLAARARYALARKKGVEQRLVDGELVMKKMKLNVEYYYLIFVTLALGIVLALNIFRTHLGRAFVAVRDRDLAAEIIGIDVFRTKLAAFGISSFYAGVTGGLSDHGFDDETLEAVVRTVVSSPAIGRNPMPAGEGDVRGILESAWI